MRKNMNTRLITPTIAILMIGMLAIPAFAEQAFLEITFKVDAKNRPKAAAVYTKYKKPFLTTIEGAQSKVLLIRKEDVQVLHGFDTEKQAESYLKSNLFNDDVARELKPLLTENPEVRIYTIH